MSKSAHIPKENIHDVALMVIQKKTYAESDLNKLTAQIGEDYLTVYSLLLDSQKRSWNGAIT